MQVMQLWKSFVDPVSKYNKHDAVKKLVIIGAGGHAKVVADAAERMGVWDVIVLVDDRYPKLNMLGSWAVVSTVSGFINCLSEPVDCLVAIGNNRTRKLLSDQLSDRGGKLVSIIHPSAVISQYSVIERGVVILAGAIVNADSLIKQGAIVNTGATVDHDCVVGPYTHICPGVRLAGEVSIGELSWIGIGTSVIQQINIGSGVLIGAGSVVVKNIASDCKAYGVPARIVS